MVDVHIHMKTMQCMGRRLSGLVSRLTLLCAVIMIEDHMMIRSRHSLISSVHVYICRVNLERECRPFAYTNICSLP